MYADYVYLGNCFTNPCNFIVLYEYFYNMNSIIYEFFNA